jgi:hypothetical protein
MTYGQIKNQVLQLLNQYTVAGTHVASSYNNQQDYLNRIPSLVNDALIEIATTMRKIPAFLTISEDDDYEEFGDRVKIELPEDFYQFKTGDTFLKTEEGHVFHTNRYQIQGRNYLLIPRRELEKHKTYTLTYYRYPRLLDLTATIDEDTELDNVPETHTAIPFYVAAFLVIQDDAFLYASFYNKYEDKLQKMLPDLSAEARQTADDYTFYNSWTYWT